MKHVSIDFANSNPGASADELLVDGIAGYNVVVTRYVLFDVNGSAVRFRSASTPLTGPIAADVVPIATQDREGVMETAVGEDLVLEIHPNTSVSGHLSYYLG